MQTAQTNQAKFIQPDELLREIPLSPGMIVADFGCGSGHYSAAAAGIVGDKGAVYALDILEESLARTAGLARLLGARNVETNLCDLETPGSCALPATFCDLVIASSILHQAENRENVIREAYRVLKTGGKLLVVEWRGDSRLGPPQERRVPESEAKKLLEEMGLRPVKDMQGGSFHYVLLYEK